MIEIVDKINNGKKIDIFIGNFPLLASELKIIDPLLVVIDPLANVKNHLVDFRFNDKTTDESFDIIVLAVPHHQFTEDGWKSLSKVVKKSQTTLVMDIKARMERSSKPQNIELWRP